MNWLVFSQKHITPFGRGYMLLYLADCTIVVQYGLAHLRKISQSYKKNLEFCSKNYWN